jgi:hypothetical protein
MQCVTCGFENVPGISRCARCASAMDLATVSIEPPRSREHPWESLIHNRLARGIRWCGVLWSLVTGACAVVFRPVPGASWTALVLTLVPGLGHWSLGRRAMGGLVFLLWLAAMLLALLAIGTGAGWFWFLTAMGAHSLTYALLLRHSLTSQSALMQAGVGLAISLCLLFLIYLPALSLTARVVGVMPVTGVHGTPVVRSGDVVLYRGPWTSHGPRRTGELVAYRIRRNAGQGFVIAAGYGLDRVVGLPGEVVELQQGTVTVNGQTLDIEHHPLGNLSRYPDVTIRVPVGTYAIFPSTLFRNHGGNLPPRLVESATVVSDADILGPVFWRLRPWGRFGPIKQPPAE